MNLPEPLIYLITEGELTAGNFNRNKERVLSLIKIAVEHKISLIQIREKNLPAKYLYKLASDAAQVAGNTAARILVNDRADIAIAAKADGVHLTENSISARIIRRNFPKDFVIGVSAHSVEAARKAKMQGANFVTYSPVFSSPGKGEPKGLEKLSEICEKLNPFPVIALGGIDETNYRSALDAGANGFAAIRFLSDIENLKKIGKEFSPTENL